MSGTSVTGDRRAPSKGQRQQWAILDALTKLLAHRPIGELTVGEIAEEAGVRRSGFYFYFESKYAALAVLTSDVWSDLMERAKAFVRFDNETVAEFIDRTAGAAVAEWHAHEAVLVASVQAIPLDEQLATLWDNWNERLAGILADQVIKDREHGHARPVSDDVPTLVRTLLEMTMHVFYQDRVNRCAESQTRTMLDTVRAIWLASAWGITTTES
ncbi:TetR/AcrR family transcriptional regulator [Mycolicibacterium sp. XJ1819]